MSPYGEIALEANELAWGRVYTAKKLLTQVLKASWRVGCGDPISGANKSNKNYFGDEVLNLLLCHHPLVLRFALVLTSSLKLVW